MKVAQDSHHRPCRHAQRPDTFRPCAEVDWQIHRSASCHQASAAGAFLGQTSLLSRHCRPCPTYSAVHNTARYFTSALCWGHQR